MPSPLSPITGPTAPLFGIDRIRIKRPVCSAALADLARVGRAFGCEAPRECEP